MLSYTFNRRFTIAFFILFIEYIYVFSCKNFFFILYS